MKFLDKNGKFVRALDYAVFSERSTIARHSVKRIIKERELIPYVCQICNIGPEWNNKPMPLILDHINGINNDNRLENLRFICSNCDSQLDTYKSRNKGRESRAASVTALKADGIHQGMAIDTTSLPPINLEMFYES